MTNIEYKALRYTAILAHLSKLGTIRATVYQKEAARMAEKWSH
jgi:hypothetical protein